MADMASMWLVCMAGAGVYVYVAGMYGLCEWPVCIACVYGWCVWLVCVDAVAGRASVAGVNGRCVVVYDWCVWLVCTTVWPVYMAGINGMMLDERIDVAMVSWKSQLMAESERLTGLMRPGYMLGV